MSRRSQCTRPVRFFGQDVPINSVNFVPPTPLTRPIEFDDDLRFLLLDVNASDSNYTHWISPDTTDRTILELYMLLYMINRIFYNAELKCCFFVQQKERLVPGNLLVRKEVVAGHVLYFGFDRQAIDELFPTCLTLAMMINAKHLDVRRLFVSPLCLDVLKTEASIFDAVKGLANSTTGANGRDSAGVFGSYTTLNELRRLLMTYHRVCHIQTEAEDLDQDKTDGNVVEPLERCHYNQLRRTMLALLNTDDTTEFAEGFLTLMSGPFLFEHSFRMARSYREMRDLIALNGKDIGLDESQIQHAISSDQKQFARAIIHVTGAPRLPIKNQALLECLQNAAHRHNWQSLFGPTSEGASFRFRLDFTSGIAWRVLAEHLLGPFASPLYTMVFPKDVIDKGMQFLGEFIDQVSLANMNEMQRQLEAYSLMMRQEGVRDITDVQGGVIQRQGMIDDVTRKYPLFTDIRNLLEKLADAFQPGSKVRELYRGPFAQLTGKLIEDAVRNPNKPMGKTLESLVGSYATLLDGHRNFHALHLNSLKNKFTGQFILAVHNPFDAEIEMSDGLLLNDFVSYSAATHSTLKVEMTELRLAVTSSVIINGKNIWVGWQGPAGTGKTTAAKSVLHGISESDGLCLQGMVREMDSVTTASLKSTNEDPLMHCKGVGFVNELGDSEKSGSLKTDGSEKATLLKNFYDSGMSVVYRGLSKDQKEVRQNVQNVIFDCVFVILANHLPLCPSLRDRMIIHTINNTTATGDRLSVGDIFQRMDQFKVGHFEIFKMLAISLVSMFEFVGCTLEDVDYLNNMEQLVFKVIDQEFHAMHLDANFGGRGRRLDNIRLMVRMLAYHRAVLTVMGCVDTFRLPWEEHNASAETLDEYNQRMMQMVVDDLKKMPLHELVRRIQEVFCPSPADYIAVVTMECLDQNPFFPAYSALARSLIDPANLETTSDGRKVFVVPDMTYTRICDVLNDRRISFEAKEIENIVEAMAKSITRDGIHVITSTNHQGGRSRDAGHGTSFFQLNFDAKMAAEVVMGLDMMNLVTQLTDDIQNRITTVVNELGPNCTHDPRFSNEMITLDVSHYGVDKNRFFGFLSHLNPNKWTSRYADKVIANFIPNAKSVQVSCDFNHARLKLMRNWMLQCSEDPRNVMQDKGYVKVHKMNQCAVLVATIIEVLVRHTFETVAGSNDPTRILLPFYKTDSTVYVHQALPILRLGITEETAQRLRQVCTPPDSRPSTGHSIEYWTFNASQEPRLMKTLEDAHLPGIDIKYTTVADALVCEQDLDGTDSGAWLHLSILSRLQDLFCTTTATSPDLPRQFVSRCMRENLTDRKTVLCFNKRGKGSTFDVIKVDEVRSEQGGHLARFDLPPKEEQDFITASLAMTREGHPSTLGVKGEIATTFPPQHETRYLTRKYLASSGKLQDIEDRCAVIHGCNYDAREKAVQVEVEALTDQWMDRVKNRYRPLRLGPTVSTVKEFLRQDGRQTRLRSRGVKRTREDGE